MQSEDAILGLGQDAKASRAADVKLVLMSNRDSHSQLALWALGVPIRLYGTRVGWDIDLALEPRKTPNGQGHVLCAARQLDKPHSG